MKGFVDEATSRNYDKLLYVVMKYFDEPSPEDNTEVAYRKFCKTILSKSYQT
ncbi:hypothetical protein FXV91_09065 [Methanosarcina sp. DH2]|jgi:hypothetical protein|uniref:hypothetical protein n=1 Tax=Methanosarcina sp. DH2 TaxID=2605639 RepID=UPI001E61DB66|nr:hypothetical protein [Methanosarcina sp. DH2]MCC4770336.1 hypothetical protein [Methanosarcina sp. DH2]